MTTYREDQGRLARMFAFWSLALLLLFGCTFLHDLIVGLGSMSEPIGGIRIPVVGVDLTPAFLVAFGILVVGVIVLYRWQETPKVADLLIETEAELRKVTWPSLEQVLNSSLVVVVCVVLIGLFLAGTDWVLARVMKGLLFGGS